MSYTNWQEHPEDFLVIYKSRIDMDGNVVTHYLIMEYTSTQSLSHILDDSKLYKWTEEMIAGGVTNITIEEFGEKRLGRDYNFRAYQQAIAYNKSRYKYYFCRVCGVFQSNPIRDEHDNPTHFRCPCCGAEFGLNDESLEQVRAYRAEWLANGAKWFISKEKPAIWNMEEQLKNIPDEFR